MEQVPYLDHFIQDAELLQAIGRVNHELGGKSRRARLTIERDGSLRLKAAGRRNK